jgi:hypothetical protein
MISEAAELLLGALEPLRVGVCVDCAATKVLFMSRETSVKATKELISTGHALAAIADCDMCDRTRPVTRLRRRHWS